MIANMKTLLIMSLSLLVQEGLAVDFAAEPEPEEQEVAVEEQPEIEDALVVVEAPRVLVAPVGDQPGAGRPPMEHSEGKTGFLSGGRLGMAAAALGVFCVACSRGVFSPEPALGSHLPPDTPEAASGCHGPWEMGPLSDALTTWSTSSTKEGEAKGCLMIVKDNDLIEYYRWRNPSVGLRMNLCRDEGHSEGHCLTKYRQTIDFFSGRMGKAEISAQEEITRLVQEVKGQSKTELAEWARKRGVGQETCGVTQSQIEQYETHNR